MPIYTLTLIDVRHVQSYLFNANELKQNLGASNLVEKAIHDFIFAWLPKNCNAAWDKKQYRLTFNDKTILKDGLSAQVIFIGGGNAAILFDARAQAIEFTQKYSRTVLEQAPGLEIAVGHIDINWSQAGAFQEAWKKLQREIMPKRKEGRAVSQPILGLAVTAECAFTGLPAVEDMKEPDGINAQLVSAEVFAKRIVSTVKEARQRLNALIPPKEPFEYPDEFDEMGSDKGHASYIAVVHADGNSMGKRIAAYIQDQDNDKMAQKMLQFSEALNEIGLKAMDSVCDQLRIVLKHDYKGYFIRDRWDQKQIVRMKDSSLPIRPIVFGGDDVTFVCDGRLGLALAVKFLEAFCQVSLPDGEPAYACAGVAIVHSHYPFARAYALAKELCDEAKQQARQLDEHSRVSMLNWHFASSGLTLGWEDIQGREYRAGKLLSRPLVVKSKSAELSTWKTWDLFVKQTQSFREDWLWGRNKLKDLQDALRKGPAAVREFVHLYEELPDLGVPDLTEARQTGWVGDTCLYFDALEANDLFIFPDEVANG